MMRSVSGKRFAAILLTAALSFGGGWAAYGEDDAEYAQEDAVIAEEDTAEDNSLDQGEEASGESSEEFIDIVVEENDGPEETESGIVDVFEEPAGSEEIEEETASEVLEEETELWEYQYAGVPNIYLQTVCDWLTLYHKDKGIPGTGMIPAISIVGFDAADRSDIRLYGHFLLCDYSLEETTLVEQKEEFLTGCMHLQQLSENEYVVSTAEVLDNTDRTASAGILTGGDPGLMRGLLEDGIRDEVRTQYIRDFVWSNGIEADSYRDEYGTVFELDYEVSESPDWISGTVQAACTKQIITVGAAAGSNAVLMLHEKQEDGSWLCTLDVPAFIGQAGLGKALEGDNRTPVGDYGFTGAFGLQEDPGSRISYIVCDDSYYWNRDSASERYNQLVTTEYEGFKAENSERIAGESYAYRYALSLSYNEGAVPYAGSGVFLHCYKPNCFWTSGGISIPEDALIYLLRHLEPDARILIDTEMNLAAQYLSAEARGFEQEELSGENLVSETE